MTKMRVRVSNGLHIDMQIDGGARSLDQHELMTEALAMLIEDVEFEDGEEDGAADLELDYYEALLGAIVRHYAMHRSSPTRLRYDQQLAALLDELREQGRLQDTLEVIDDQAPEE